jgi:hypothetical protein
LFCRVSKTRDFHKRLRRADGKTMGNKTRGQAHLGLEC